MKLLALDLGERRIGVAVSDELGMFAHPRETILCGGKREFQQLVEVVRSERPSAIVVGHPLEMSGQRGERALWVEKFCERLRGHLSRDPELREIKFHLWDERLTSTEAERNLRGSRLRGEERKAMTDSVAAVIILESFLEGMAKGRA